MKNKRIKLTQTGHYVVGVVMAFLILIAIYHIVNPYYPATYYKNDKEQVALWFYLWFMSAFISLVSTIPLAIEWERPIIFEKFSKRGWIAAMLFTLFHIFLLIVLSVPWCDIRLFEIVDK